MVGKRKLLNPLPISEMLGSFVKIKERQTKMITRTVTTKAAEQAVKDDNFISPAGHMMFLKNKTVEGDNFHGQLISLGGARMAETRTWSMASTLMSRTIDISEDGLKLGDLSDLKSFQVTSSHKNKTCKGSVTPCLVNAGAIDLEPEESFMMNIIVYGGQFTDKVVTSDEIISIMGNLDGNINNSTVKVTKYPAKELQFTEFTVPGGWSKGSHLVQKGDVPTSRTGAGFSKLCSSDDGSFLLSTGGHSKIGITKPFFHPDDCINLLKVPEMSWTKLEPNDNFKRSFHSMSINGNREVFIVGGMSLIGGLWSRIHPLNEVLKITFEEDFSYTGTTITLQSDIRELSILTNFSFAANEKKLYFFSGFKYDKYNNDNLHEFLPPKTSRDKLPEFGRALIKVDIEEGKVEKIEGPEDFGGNNGSIVMLNGDEMIITVDPHIYFYSERMLQSPKCDLDESFGSCTMPVTSKNTKRYQCQTPACLKSIHLKCDKSMRGNTSSARQMCPVCRGLDPVTWKPVKTVRLGNRR